MWVLQTLALALLVFLWLSLGFVAKALPESGGRPLILSYSVVFASLFAQGLALAFLYGEHRKAKRDLSEINGDLARELERRRTLERELEAAGSDALRSADVKAEFLATMSHEVRTPLHGVIGMASLLAQSKLDATQREMVDAITASGEYLLKTLTHILDYSKMHAGKIELESLAFEPAALFTEALETFEPLAKEQGLRFEVHIGHEAGLRVQGDPGRVGQIVTNLVGNAFKFTSTGGVDVRTWAHDEGGEYLRFYCEVNDTGVGVSKEFEGRIFEAFAHAGPSGARSLGGAGLGLAICKALVDRMGGTLFHSPRPGGGSSFGFSIPLLSAGTRPGSQEVSGERPLEARPSGTRPIPTSSAQSKRRILVAEDNLVNKMVVEHALRSFGVECVVAANGQEALEAYTRDKFDLVLMDLQMPVLDGLSATRAIRAREPEGQRIPILGFTACVFPEEQGAALASGMDAVIAKPIAVPALRKAIQHYLDIGDEAVSDEAFRLLCVADRP